jgi:hypothetical protein
LYPVVLIALVPFRSYILWQIFRKEDIKHLDPDTESEEDYEEEQRRIYLARLNPSFDDNEEDMHIPSRAEFRSKGLQKAMHDHANLQAQTILNGGVSNPTSQINYVKAAGEDPESVEISDMH